MRSLASKWFKLIVASTFLVEKPPLVFEKRRGLGEVIAFATVPAIAESDVVYLTCFHDETKFSGEELQLQKLECCRKLAEFHKKCCSKDAFKESKCCAKQGVNPDFASYCATTIATMPQVSLFDSNVDSEETTSSSLPNVTFEGRIYDRAPSSSLVKPVFSLVMAYGDDDDHQESLRSDEDSVAWRQCCIDDRAVIFGEKTGVPSPFSLISESGGASSVQANLTSELSIGGGMHRSLTHTMTLALPKHDTEFPFGGSLILYVFLSEGVFIDVEDPMDGPCSCTIDAWSCGASIVSTAHAVIDIEQPAFVSPQHVVAININVEGVATPSLTTVTLRVATKFHLRYPALAAAGNHVPLVLPAPLLRSGSFFRGQDPIDFVPISTYSEPIRLNVAAGIEEDFGWVVALTILCSIVGSVVVLRDIVRVSKWV